MKLVSINAALNFGLNLCCNIMIVILCFYSFSMPSAQFFYSCNSLSFITICLKVLIKCTLYSEFFMYCIEINLDGETDREIVSEGPAWSLI